MNILLYSQNFISIALDICQFYIYISARQYLWALAKLEAGGSVEEKGGGAICTDSSPPDPPIYRPRSSPIQTKLYF